MLTILLKLKVNKTKDKKMMMMMNKIKKMNLKVIYFNQKLQFSSKIKIICKVMDKVMMLKT